MTNQQILERAIAKAIEGGWNIGLPNYRVDEDGACAQFELDGIWYPSSDYDELSVNDILYSHDFAKALWGEWEIERGTVHEAMMVPEWQYHLQQLVVAPDPIAYLGEHIDG